MAQYSMWVEAGDTFFTHSNSLLGKLIRWGEKEKGELDGAWANHTGVVIQSGYLTDNPCLEPKAVVIEALWKTRKGPIQLNNILVRVFRPVPSYAKPELDSFAVYAETFVGDSYGWWKLLGFLARRATGIDFPAMFYVKDHPICSYLAAWVNELARPRWSRWVKLPDETFLEFKDGWPGFGLDPRTADPDEMLDYCEEHPEFWTEVK